jgi:uncharacterized protein
MKRKKPTYSDGIRAVERLKKVALKRSDIHIHTLFLFGSIARDQAHQWSDIDIAIVCDPFEQSKVKEVRTFYALDPERDVRISIIVLHLEEFENRYSTIAQELKRDGIVV